MGWSEWRVCHSFSLLRYRTTKKPATIRGFNFIEENQHARGARTGSLWDRIAMLSGMRIPKAIRSARMSANRVVYRACRRVDAVSNG